MATEILNGPKRLRKLISRMHYLPETFVKEVLKCEKKCMKCFCTSKSRTDCISIIKDDSTTKHVLKFRLILKTRQNFEGTQQNPSVYWQFKISKISIIAENYTGLFHWKIN